MKKIKWLLSVVLFFMLFLMGCHETQRTSVIVSDGHLGVRLRYVGPHHSHHHYPCRVYSCGHCRTRRVVLRDVSNTMRYGRVYRKIRGGHRHQRNHFGQRKNK